MGGHHHRQPQKVPDPSIYKVEAVPQMKQVVEALGRKGLRDPWLRNEVWWYLTPNIMAHTADVYLKFYTVNSPSVRQLSLQPSASNMPWAVATTNMVKAITARDIEFVYN